MQAERLVTFAAPGRLWLLVVPVAFAVAYAVLQWHRRRVVERFAESAMLPSVLPDPLGRVRHVAAALLVAMTAMLVVGIARPETEHRTPRKTALVILAIDTSASMAATDVGPTRLVAAEREALSFARSLPEQDRVGLVTFGRTASVLLSPTVDREALAAALRTLTAAHATGTASAIQVALQLVADARAQTHTTDPATIVLLSDGSPSVGLDGASPSAAVDAQAARAKSATIPIDTIAFGTATGTVTADGRTSAAPADPVTMQRVAHASGGRSFTAATAKQLQAAYRNIGRTVGYRTTHHDLTAWATGVALALALVAAGAGLLWTRRLL